MHIRLVLGLCLAAFLTSGCQTAYYEAWETVGVHKRDILIDRVEDVQDAQGDAKKQFSSALEQYQQLIHIEDQNLLKRYKALNSEFEDSEEAAKAVSKRIDDVEDVSEDLFKEWQKELDLYTNAELKQQSASTLSSTKKKYKKLVASMRAAEAKMAPVLNALRDQVLFLKHNLNARAIDSLKGELSSIESNVATLVKEMEKSIAESEAFINELNNSN